MTLVVGVRGAGYLAPPHGPHSPASAAYTRIFVYVAFLLSRNKKQLVF